MNDIKCPHCKKIFKIDESGFADILKQVKNQEFEKELQDKLELLEKDKINAIEMAKINTKSELQSTITKKEAELEKLKVEKNSEIEKLLHKLQSNETEKKLAITEAVNGIERERDELRNKLQSKNHEMQLKEVSLKERYEKELQLKNETIEHYKDMKLKLSTKMIGETLEQHCETEFNKLRATGFQNAYFEKDNDIKTGSKGDYIYRETDESGTEIVSIMFEMKNENDQTATKHKNEDFLRELNKDRNEKKMRICCTGITIRNGQRSIQHRYCGRLS